MSDISIVTPCRNGSAWLGATLRSALNQTLPPKEIIVVDDGSIDDSREIAGRFGPVVTVHAGVAKGAAVARNVGAALAQGDRIMFLDADDLLVPGTLAALSGALDEVAEDEAAGRDDLEAFAICPWDRLGRDGDGALAPWHVSPASNELPLPGRDALANWLTGTWSPPCCVLWTRAGFEASGGWLPAAGLDDDGNLLRRAMARGVRRSVAPDGLALYRRLPADVASYSARRLQPFGLESRIASLDDTVAELERAGTVARYRPALVAALTELGGDARAYPPYREAIDGLIDRAGGRRAGDGGLLRAARLGARGKAWLDEKRRRARPTSATGAAPDDPGDDAPLLDGSSGNPVVSVVIPTFDREDTVARAVSSVLSQSYPAIELIVVDDGSTDDTGRVLAAFDDARLRVVRQANGGVAAARNRGVLESTGRYVAFLDSDDEWLPGKLELQVRALESTGPRIGLCCGAVEFRRPGKAPAIVRPPASPSGSTGNRFGELLLDNTIPAVNSSALVRREVFESTGGFDASLPAIEDWDWLQRVARLYHIVVLDRVLAVYHDDDDVDDRRSRALRNNMDARDMLWRRNRHALRRAGTAHRYAHESARRELREAEGDVARGRALVLQMLSEKPLPPTSWLWLPYMFAPRRLRSWLRDIDGRRA